MNNKKFILTILMTVSLCSLLFYCMQWKILRNEKEVLKNNIVSIFQKYILTHDIDKESINPKEVSPSYPHPSEEYEELSKKVSYYIEKQQPIILTMVGFPYKSSNTRDKVISSSADAAECYSLRFLQNFLDEIKSIYTPGVQLLIFTDGIVFCDIEKVSDDTVINYENTLKILAKDLPDIKILTMTDLYTNQSPEKIREIISTMIPSEEVFQDMIKSDIKLQDDIALLTQRMSFEFALAQLQEQDIIDIALQETRRSMQYSNFLKNFRPDTTITCSVHYQKHLNKKIGLKLSNSCVTPWHGMLVKKDNDFTIKHLQDLDRSQHKLVQSHVHQIPLSYFQYIGK